jgi:hypothetical protein
MRLRSQWKTGSFINFAVHRNIVWHRFFRVSFSRHAASTLTITEFEIVFIFVCSAPRILRFTIENLTLLSSSMVLTHVEIVDVCIVLVDTPLTLVTVLVRASSTDSLPWNSITGGPELVFQFLIITENASRSTDSIWADTPLLLLLSATAWASTVFYKFIKLIDIISRPVVVRNELLLLLSGAQHSWTKELTYFEVGSNPNTKSKYRSTCTKILTTPHPPKAAKSSCDGPFPNIEHTALQGQGWDISGQNIPAERGQRPKASSEKGSWAWKTAF